MKISKGGPIIVNRGLPYEHKNVRLIEIDLRTKRADVSLGSDGDIPCVLLSKTDDTCYENKEATEYFTRIEFPEYKGWNFMMAEVCKYSLLITMVKKS